MYFKILSSKGSKSKSIGISAAFGAVGALVADSMNKDDNAPQLIEYKCVSCGKKFDSFPLLAQPEEILSAPCNITFKRKSSFVGMAVSQLIWLNGVKISPVKNGKVVQFQTITKHNTIFVTDQFGVAFKGNYKFEAQPGGMIEVQFNRKFKNT